MVSVYHIFNLMYSTYFCLSEFLSNTEKRTMARFTYHNFVKVLWLSFDVLHIRSLPKSLIKLVILIEVVWNTFTLTISYSTVSFISEISVPFFAHMYELLRIKCRFTFVNRILRIIVIFPLYTVLRSSTMKKFFKHT